MDWSAVNVSLTLAAWTTLVLLPVGLALARWLAVTAWAGRPFIEALLLLPLLLPPTVIGFYFLVAFGQGSALGAWLAHTMGWRLVFSMEGLLLVSVLVNLPFMVQPIQRAFAAVPHSLREAAWVSGLSGWQTFWRIDLPLAWPGLLAGMALTVAHTLGEFGVVLMVGGNIAGETRTLSVSLYDKVQGMALQSAHVMALALVGVSLLALTVVLAFDRVGQRGRALQGRCWAACMFSFAPAARSVWPLSSTVVRVNWWPWSVHRAVAKPACCVPSRVCGHRPICRAISVWRIRLGSTRPQTCCARRKSAGRFWCSSITPCFRT